VNESIRIGEWTVDPRGNQLCRGSDVVRVEPKVMDLLMLLAGHAGRVVARDEILAAIWPRMVVGDEALTQCVIKLRRALCDSSRTPVYIETVAKRGYRLIAPVTPLPVIGQADGKSSPGAPARRRASEAVPTPLAWTGAVLVVFLVVLGLMLAWPSDDAPATREADLHADPSGAWITVSVEPFGYVGAAAGQAYLAAGIGDDLASDLSRAPGLRIVRAARADSATGARYTVSGSVQRDGGTVRINVFLADAATREQVWAGRFERAYGDLFVLQDDITRRLLDVLPAKIDEAERSRVARRYTQSLAAYDAFQRGQALFLARTPADNEAARALYREAIALDPKFARAYASLAMTYAMDDRLGAPGPSSPALDRAFELAETARLIDPDVPQVLWALGFVDAQARRHGEAIRALTRAIELDPSFADAYALLGGVRTYTGQPRETIPLLRTAMRLNPGAGYLYYLLLGRAYLFDDDVEQALVNLRAAAQRNPLDVETRVFLAAALVAGNDVAGARWEADEVRALRPSFSARAWLETYPMTSRPQRERLLALLDRVQL
jgi:DNA-binding winged helix-turn-helix (wHTH) protein/TolB-like protein/cytochrome c-type biogenesis protein CcmH/NrfG